MGKSDKKWCKKETALVLTVGVSFKDPFNRVSLSLHGLEQKTRKCIDTPKDVTKCILNHQPLDVGQASIKIQGSIQSEGEILAELDIERCEEARNNKEHPMARALGYAGLDGLAVLKVITGAICGEGEPKEIEAEIKVIAYSLDSLKEIKIGILDSPDKCKRCKTKITDLWLGVPEKLQDPGTNYDDLTSMIGKKPVPLEGFCNSLGKVNQCLEVTLEDLEKLVDCMDAMDSFRIKKDLFWCWAWPKCNVEEKALEILGDCLCLDKH